MERAEQLEEMSLHIKQWQAVAEGVIAGELDAEEQIDEAAAQLAEQLLSGELSHRRLRHGVYFANKLDGDQSRAVSSNLLEGDNRLERTAYRMMHHAGRAAFKGFKSEKRRQERRAEQARYRMGMVG